jgi:hypothetical protein
LRSAISSFGCCARTYEAGVQFFENRITSDGPSLTESNRMYLDATSASFTFLFACRQSQTPKVAVGAQPLAAPRVARRLVQDAHCEMHQI